MFILLFLHLQNVTFKWKTNFENMVENNSCFNEYFKYIKYINTLKDIKIHYLLSHHYINIISYSTYIQINIMLCWEFIKNQTLSAQVQTSVKRDLVIVFIHLKDFLICYNFSTVKYHIAKYCATAQYEFFVSICSSFLTCFSCFFVKSFST